VNKSIERLVQRPPERRQTKTNRGATTRIPALTALFSLFIIRAAHAADPTQLIGKWVEHLRNGAAMITEFTPNTISFYAVDPSGKPNTEPKPQEVTYKDLGQTIVIEFKGGGGLMAMMKDQQSMVLIFPGMGSHSLTRVQP
jgi:hypothetical protein